MVGQGRGTELRLVVLVGKLILPSCMEYYSNLISTKRLAIKLLQVIYLILSMTSSILNFNSNL